MKKTDAYTLILNCLSRQITILVNTAYYILISSKNIAKGRYTTIITECRLNEYLHKIDLEANEMLETIVLRLATERGIDENLKARDMLRWVAEMNNVKASAEEIVMREAVLV